MLPPPPESQGPLSSQERWSYGLFLLLLFGLFAAEVARDYNPRKLSVLFVVVFWAPALALHETAHAVAAQNGLAASDGLGILRSFWLPEEYFRALMNAPDVADEPPPRRPWPDQDEEDWE